MAKHWIGLVSGDLRSPIACRHQSGEQSHKRYRAQYGQKLDHHSPDGLTAKQRERGDDESFAGPAPGTENGKVIEDRRGATSVVVRNL